LEEGETINHQNVSISKNDEKLIEQNEYSYSELSIFAISLMAFAALVKYALG